MCKKVSVVVPIYNVEKYLNKCVLSLIKQTYKNLEIILVDDESPDRCPGLCDKWANRDNRIKVIHKKNAGLGMARNTGIDNATGDYITFVDSDDYIDLDTIEKAYGMAKKERADVVYYGHKNVGPSGKVIDENTSDVDKLVYRNDEVYTQILPELLANDSSKGKTSKLMLSACTALFSLDLIKKASWHFVSEREIISEDVYSLMILFAHIKCVAIVPESLYSYRQNNLSLTRTYRNDRYNGIKHFYDQTIQLCKIKKYPEIIESRLGSVYLAFVIAALKIIVMSDMGFKEKMNNINIIVRDPHMEHTLSTIDDRVESPSRKLIKHLLAKKQLLLCYFVLKVKCNLKK